MNTNPLSLPHTHTHKHTHTHTQTHTPTHSQTHTEKHIHTLECTQTYANETYWRKMKIRYPRYYDVAPENDNSSFSAFYSQSTGVPKKTKTGNQIFKNLNENRIRDIISKKYKMYTQDIIIQHRKMVIPALLLFPDTLQECQNICLADPVISDSIWTEPYPKQRTNPVLLLSFSIVFICQSP